jgi:hypothetical protein
MYNRETMHAEKKVEFCTIRQAALWSGLAVTTWYQGMAGTSAVPRIRFGRSIRLLRTDVEHFINARITAAKQDFLPTLAATPAIKDISL